MAEVTVLQLAGVVGIPVEKLLQQMKDAGLDHNEAEQTVTDDEKQQLLMHLKKSHGDTGGDGRKITLKRKSVSKLKVSGSQGKSKTVNVEVRKKRTYVKRSVIVDEEAVAAEAKAAEEAKLKAEAEAKAAEEAKLQAEAEAKAKAEAEEKAKADAEKEQASKTAADIKKEVESEPSTLTQPAAPKKIKSVSTKAAAAAPQVEAKKPAKQESSAENEAKRKAENKARLEAEEKARQKTLEDAKRIAEELEKRKDDDKSDVVEEDTDSIVQQAFEESIEREEKQTKRGARRPEKKKTKLTAKRKQTHGFQNPTGPAIYNVEIGDTVVVSDLAQKMSVKGTEVVKTLMGLGVMATINQSIDQETAAIVIEEMGHKVVLRNDDQLETNLVESLDNKSSTFEEGDRSPVVTIMGHVDHGKTSLLDYIRRAKVADGEAGGITQHIGAYHVETDKGMVTFLDTPGHAAFTAMRARGAKATDLVILVVAADDGMMPQTEEAIDHARAAEVPIIVAVNKIDKEEADPDRVKNELSTKEVIPEDWGGDTQFVNVSAHSGEGIDELLEAILLQAELLELKAVQGGPARGAVIEARLDKGRGVVASLLVQSGELKTGDMILAGPHFGRVRAMVDENGRPIDKAGPSIPVEVLGLAGVPEAGDEFLGVPDEKKAREVADFRQEKERQHKLARQQAGKLENIFDTLKADQKASVNIVLKTDVRGSLEALIGAIHDLGTDEVAVNIVSSGVGGINESDVNLALTSNATIFGFNVRTDAAAKKVCQEESIEVRYYSVIYDIINDIKSAMSGLLEPERREEIVGTAEVRDVFRSSKFGAAAGCIVVEGSLFRNKPIRVLRDDIVIFEGELESLRRFKDDVGEVKSGVECGVAVKSYNDVKVGDKIEAFDVKIIARTL